MPLKSNPFTKRIVDRAGDFIDKIKAELAVKGILRKRKESRAWLINKYSDLSVKARDILKDKTLKKTSPSGVIMGKMFFYYYDAKWKKKLPFWDAFPLVIPIEQYSDGFLGLNLHYLRPTHRAALLSKLMAFTTDTNLNEETRMRLSYELLKSTSVYRLAKPAIKRYLYSHIRSHLVEIDAPEWEIVIFLPVENFNVNKEKVWEDSES